MIQWAPLSHKAMGTKSHQVVYPVPRRLVRKEDGVIPWPLLTLAIAWEKVIGATEVRRNKRTPPSQKHPAGVGAVLGGQSPLFASVLTGRLGTRHEGGSAL